MLIKAEPALFLISFPVCARSDRDYTVDEFCMAKKKHYENKKTVYVFVSVFRAMKQQQ